MRVVMGTLLCLMVSTSPAEPTVIFDSGNTTPIGRYHQMISGAQIPDFGDAWSSAQRSELEAEKADPANPENWLPITTTKLSPGKVHPRAVQLSELASPICVIGSDSMSTEWIRTYHNALVNNGVLCWLVEASTLDDVQRIVQVLNGIPMSPADGNAIAEFFQIQHYPVLITHRFIEQ